MQDNRKLRIVMILLGVLFAVLTVEGLIGCRHVAHLDKQLFGVPAGGDDPATPGIDESKPEQPGMATPVVEITASILALAGYGGMARWISKSNKNGKATSTQLEDRIAALEKHRRRTDEAK